MCCAQIVNRGGTVAISEQCQFKNPRYLNNVLPFLHMHAHTHYANTGCLTQKWALKLLEAPSLPSHCPQCIPKCKRLFSFCYKDCAQHSLGMVELSTVKARVCLLWSQTCQKQPETISKTPPGMQDHHKAPSLLF